MEQTAKHHREAAIATVNETIDKTKDVLSRSQESAEKTKARLDEARSKQ
jgi:hypothetical protein